MIPNLKVIMSGRGVQLTCRIIVADAVRKDEYQKKLNYDAFEPMKKKRQVGFYRQNNFVKIKRVLPLYLADTML
ncbi:hypothetical protein SAMN02745152_01659 [Treponema berlinense]|uniref:Uncharacterized protein n=2 Tax=Treponema berlinense TaxID=225004 RepID=A0A1T4PPS1_9SPIR|nr:hypothetical protein SAMN02745152_01659 [Treponema berlinense]